MDPKSTVPLFEMFPFMTEDEKLAADYNGARVINAKIDKNERTMQLILSLETPIAPSELNILEAVIAGEFNLKSVDITPSYRASADNEAQMTRRQPAGSTRSTKTLMGTVPKKVKTVPISDITIEHGKVAILGDVCHVSSRYLDRRRAWILAFDLTDNTGTLHISKFMPDDMEKKAAHIARSIHPGMHLIVTGKLNISRFDGDLTLEPTGITTAVKELKQDTAEDKRVELHLHTKMSALDAVTDIEEAITRAARWGHPAIAITDHGVVQSFPEASATVRAIKDKTRVIYGVEGYFQNDSDITETTEAANDTAASQQPAVKRKRRTNHIIILTKNQTGLKNLYKLITISHLEDFSRYPIIKKTVLDKHRDGLIIGSACESGEFFEAVVKGSPDDELKQMAQYYDYLEIQPICNNMYMLGKEFKGRSITIEDLKDFNRKVVEIGDAVGIPTVATGDVHFLDPEHEVFRHILLTSKGFENATADLPLYFRTTNEMLEEFDYLGQETAYRVVVKNTQDIAALCEHVDPLPPPKTLFPPELENSALDLKILVQTELRKLYGEHPPDEVRNRFDVELNDILKSSYDVIYMSAQKLVAASRRQGYLVGSRGSVGSSLIAYLAGITEVNSLPAHYRCPKCKKTEFNTDPDPSGETAFLSTLYGCGADMPDKLCPDCRTPYIKDGFNIPFETFLGFGGDKVPDIDLNFSGEYQAQAHKHVIDLFGADKVYRAGTIGTIKEKTAFGYVRNYLETIGKVTTKADENRLARGCVGVKRTTGQHPGGLIVIPQDKEITDFCPAQHPADDVDKGIITTHFDYHCMEDNLIKLDGLGHDDPTMIKMLEDMTGVTATDIKFDDPGTMSIFTSPEPLGLPDDDDVIGGTGTIGIPEFGTDLTRDMLRDTAPRDFDTLVRLSGYSHGENVWLGNAKDLIIEGKAVSETISCRDDIMLYLISKGLDAHYAFNISESVRKGFGLPKGAETMMKEHAVPEWYINSCIKINYLFPKAHAVAYVMMAFRIAWFKVHKPLEFYSAHFYRRSRKNAFDAAFMLHGIDRVRVKIKEIRNNPDAKSKEEELLTTLESCYEFYMRGFEFAKLDLYDSDPVRFLITSENKLRPPFVAINGLGETAAYDIAENRKNRSFISIDDISASCSKVSKTHLEQLKTLGALRDLPETSQMSLF